MQPNKTKSRTFKRKQVKLPGGRTEMHFEYKKPSKRRCSGCGGLLHGMAVERPTKLARMAKTKKRPQRAYAGTLCSKCARQKIKEEARK